MPHLKLFIIFLLLHNYILCVYSWQCAAFFFLTSFVENSNSVYKHLLELNEKEHLNNMTEKCLKEKVPQVSVGECVRKLIKSFITSSVWESGPLWATGACDRTWVIGSLSFSERGASALTESCMVRGHTDRQDRRKEYVEEERIRRTAEWRREKAVREKAVREKS